MTNIVMIARDRQRLTKQALESLHENTDKDSFNLTFVDDGSNLAFQDFLPRNLVRMALRSDTSNITVELTHPVGIVGFARNLGVEVAQKYFGRGDFLYFSDNDVYFKPGWLERMTDTLSANYQLAVLGGVRHPYHQRNKCYRNTPTEGAHGWDEVDAVAGYSMLTYWGTWDTYGPFDAHAHGVCKSEDWALCQKAIKAGCKVGYIHPPVLVNCGLTNTLGEKVPGYDEIERVEGVVQE